ncbi:MAG: MFS transporter, partial [Candidatus Bipolaricaulia bacterium]
MKPKPGRWFYAFTLAFIAAGSASLLLPLFAVTVLRGTVGQIGLMASLASLAGVPFSILWGRLSDRLARRKPFVILAFAGAGVGLLLMGLSRSIGQLILFNALMNSAWVAGSAVSTLLAIEGIERNRWESRIGRFNRYTGAGWVSGLAIGAIWSHLAVGLPGSGLRELFYLLAALDLGAMLLALRWIRERPVHFRRRGFPGAVVAVGNMLVERFRYAPFHLYYL